MATMKVATTGQVKEINLTEGNRRLSDEGVGLLDPDGLHVLESLMFHEERDVRCFAYLKMSGEREPARVVLDVPPGVFHGLPDAEGFGEG